ncbi:hypothetical protein Tco_1196529, partial [Tanacetum coccineum]
MKSTSWPTDNGYLEHEEGLEQKETEFAKDDRRYRCHVICWEQKKDHAY